MKKTLGILILLALIGAATSAVAPNFMTSGNFINMARWSGLYGIIAIGVGFVIITGGIDLSIGALIALTGSLFPLLLVGMGLPLPLAVGSVVGVSLLVGLIHGLLITKLRLQPFVVTLCGLFIYRGTARAITGDQNQGFGNAHESLRDFVGYRFADLIPMPFVIMIVIGILAAVFLNLTTYGRYLLALGKNEEAAKFSGIHVDRMKIFAYMICSVLAGLAGMLFALDQNSVQPSTFGNFYELYAIAGAVLGGCSLRGGEGAISGIIAGTLLVEFTKNAAFFLGVPDAHQFSVIGLFILIGVIVDELLGRVGAARRARISAKA